MPRHTPICYPINMFLWYGRSTKNYKLVSYVLTAIKNKIHNAIILFYIFINTKQNIYIYNTIKVIKIHRNKWDLII